MVYIFYYQHTNFAEPFFERNIQSDEDLFEQGQSTNPVSDTAISNENLSKNKEIEKRAAESPVVKLPTKRGRPPKSNKQK